MELTPPPARGALGGSDGNDSFAVGDSVYVRGHGPARIIALVDGSTTTPAQACYRVEYPNGDAVNLPASALRAHLRSAKRVRAGAKNCQGSPVLANPSGGNHSDRNRLELLRPSAGSPSRRLLVPNAIFNLVCTMCGGGMLSLPFAFRSCGLLLGGAILLVSGLASAFSIELLIACSRADGSDTYEQVMASALGPWARQVCGLMLFVLTFLCAVAYLVLIADLVSPVLTWCCFDVTYAYRSVLMSVVMVLITPMCLSASLSALRILNVFGLCAVFFVAVAIAINALPKVGTKHDVWTSDASGHRTVTSWEPVIHWYPRDFGSVIYAVPLFALSFLAHFNVLGAQAELRFPTRARVSTVTFGTIISCVIFYMFFGIIGYIFSGDLTCGNTLLNFPGDSGLLAATRVSLALCLSNNLPLLVLPCRAALHRLTASVRGDVTEERERTPSEAAAHLENQRAQEVHVYERGREECGSFDRYLPNVTNAYVPVMSRVRRYLYTIGIILAVLLLSCCLPSILVVWSFAGSTTCFVIAFVFPAAAWIRARGDGANRFKQLAAWLLLVTSIVLIIACTVMSILRVDPNPCPK